MEAHVSDNALVARWVARRDAEAFKEIVSRHSAMVYATCRRVLGDPAEAEDVTQECFLRLAQADARPGAHLPGWLHRVATNRSLDHLRSEQSRRKRENAYAAARPAATEIAWHEVEPLIDEAIEALPEKLRRPLIGHFLEDLTHEAIAQALGVPRRTVSYRIGKGIETIRKHLKKRGLPVGCSAIASMMGIHLIEAAPPAVTAALGKLAVAGLVHAGTATAGLAAKAALGGGIALMTKKVVAGLIALVILLMLAFSLSDTLTKAHDEGQPGPPTQKAHAPESEPADGTAQADATTQTPDSQTATPALASAGDEAALMPETEEAADAEQSVTQEPASISGYVMDAEAYPLQGASVHLDVTGDTLGLEVLQSYDAKTNSKGHYELSGIQSFGQGNIYVSAKGYSAQWRAAIGLYPGAQIIDLSFALAEAAHYVAGQVVAAEGTPIGGASIWLRHFGYSEANPSGGSNTSLAGFALAISEEDGGFEIAVDGEGLCDFTVLKEGYAPGFFAKVPTGTNDARFVLAAGGGISGHVTRPNGSPAPGMQIEVAGGAYRAGEVDP
ncbi:MAG TPA: sigma-70 family RNA polymerase sigma factor, partial [Candidatus Hydrogenedentes bacterium]|nr:sigma-70 family RNA polymerase sigma factor [Candidatus Hydrogenedentota bacterium]